MEGTPLLERIRDGAWLDQQVFPPIEWVVPGLVAEGFGLVVGPPKLGKSWFVLGLALSAACGGKALGHVQVKQRPVLYAALEDGDRRMQHRARHLMAGEPIPAGFAYFTRATPGELLPLLAEWLDRHPQGLVLLDTLGKVMPNALPGENAYQRDYRVGGHLKAIADDHPGSALLVVHHNRKMIAADWMDSTSGTQGLNGSADYTIVLERVRGEGEALLKVTGRDVTEAEYAVTMTGGSWALVGDSLKAAAEAAREAQVSAGLGEDSQRIIAEVGRHPEGVRPGEIAETLDLATNKVRTYLRRAVDAGRIASPGRGLYTPVTSVTSVTSDPDEQHTSNGCNTLSRDATHPVQSGTDLMHLGSEVDR